MSPEEIKKIETQGARRALLESLMNANTDLTEAINSYRQIEDTFYQAHNRQIEFAKQIKTHIAKITVLINHLQPGT